MMWPDRSPASRGKCAHGPMQAAVNVCMGPWNQRKGVPHGDVVCSVSCKQWQMCTWVHGSRGKCTHAPPCTPMHIHASTHATPHPPSSYLPTPDTIWPAVLMTKCITGASWPVRQPVSTPLELHCHNRTVLSVSMQSNTMDNSYRIVGNEQRRALVQGETI